MTPKHGVKHLAEGNAKQVEGAPVMSGARIIPARLRQLAAELPDRYTAPLMHLSRARVLSGRQLDRLLWQPGTASRTAERARQRALSRLGQLGLVATLDRRIGGVRAGSAGHVHVHPRPGTNSPPSHG